MIKNAPSHQSIVERIVAWVGSVPSLAVHSCIFIGFLLLTLSNIFPRDLVLLVWNTAVSLEAIYLAIFIQITVNRQGKSLREVEEDIDEIQEDVEELGEDVEEISEDIEGISEDIDEIQGDVDEIQEDVEEITDDAAEPDTHAAHHRTLEQLTTDMRSILSELESLKEGK